MVNYEKIQIVPTLHRNVLNFMGMLNRESYVATKKIKDRFIALNKKNELSTWNIMTGKLESTHKLTNFDISDYEIYSYEAQDISYKMNWCNSKILLKQKAALENITDEDYYDPEMLRTSLSNNKSHLKILGKTFHNFKVIEIVNEYEIKEHFTFVHPFYGVGKYQRIYMSSNLEYMLERLQNQRVFLYQRQPSNESN
jgi:hypothetical protein